MSCNYREDNHLTEEMLKRLTMGKATVSERLAALSHICECEACEQRFSEAYEQGELLKLPPQFAEGVKRKLSEVRITATPLSLGMKKVEYSSGSRPVKKGWQDQQKEFRRYSCRVAIAACLALLLLFSGTFSMGMSALSKSKVLNPDLSVVNQLTQNLSNFSRDIIQWEEKKQ